MNRKLANFFSCGFLYNPQSDSVLLHQRDGNTVYNPFSWAFFGGLNEGNETEIECFQRELLEEIGLAVPIHEIIYLNDYFNSELKTHRFIYYVISEIDKKDLKLGEGLGFNWIKIDSLFEIDLTEKTERDLKFFIKNIINSK